MPADAPVTSTRRAPSLMGAPISQPASAARRTRRCPEARRDSRAAQRNTPWAISDGSAAALASLTSARTWCTAASSGAASAASSARSPASRRSPAAAAACARSARAAAPPASSASAVASTASGAGLRWAGLPSYQPP